MKRIWWVVTAVAVGWVIVVGVLLQQNFFGLFQPDDLGRWQQPAAPAFVQPQGWDDRVTMARRMIEGALPEQAPAYTLEQVDRIAARVTPIVERACARDFVRPPSFRLVKRSELAESLSRSMITDIETRTPNLKSPFMKLHADEVAAIQSAAILGRYEPQDKVLLLAPGNLRPLMDSNGVAGRLLDPLLTLVIAHELTHALQDQVIDLSRPTPIDAADARLAFHSVVEGHAVLVQELVGAELDLDDSVIELSLVFSAGAATPDEAVFNLVERADAVQFERIYLGGRDFVAWHRQAGGPDRVWEILAAPPAQTSMIAAPETYSTQPTWSADWYVALRDVVKDFGRDWTIDDSASLSNFELHTIYADLDRAERDRLVASLEHVQAVHLRESLIGVPNPDWDRASRATLYLLVLRDAADVPPFFAALERFRDSPGQRQEYGDPDVEWYPRELDAMQADDWTCMSASSDGATYTRLHARRGRILCDLRIYADGTSDEALGAIVNSIFDHTAPLARE